MSTNLNIRVPKRLMADFEAACQDNYTNKSEVLRRAMLDYVKENQGGNKVKTTMSWAEICDEARRRAYDARNITDDRAEFEKDPNLWLVKDMQLVVDAHTKDIEAGDTAEYSEPAEFLDKHDIEWE